MTKYIFKEKVHVYSTPLILARFFTGSAWENSICILTINIINRKVVTNPSFDHLYVQINLLLTIQFDLVVEFYPNQSQIVLFEHRATGWTFMVLLPFGFSNRQVPDRYLQTRNQTMFYQFVILSCLSSYFLLRKLYANHNVFPVDWYQMTKCFSLNKKIILPSRIELEELNTFVDCFPYKFYINLLTSELTNMWKKKIV